jgi:hypothetical protein
VVTRPWSCAKVRDPGRAEGTRAATA